MPQVGPITMWVNSTTRMPESGRRSPRDRRTGLFARDLATGFFARDLFTGRRFGAARLFAFAIRYCFFFVRFGGGLRSGFWFRLTGSKPT